MSKKAKKTAFKTNAVFFSLQLCELAAEKLLGQRI